jgi:hypothetical protein
MKPGNQEARERKISMMYPDYAIERHLEVWIVHPDGETSGS